MVSYITYTVIVQVHLCRAVLSLPPYRSVERILHDLETISIWLV